MKLRKDWADVLHLWLKEDRVICEGAGEIRKTGKDSSRQTKKEIPKMSFALIKYLKITCCVYIYCKLFLGVVKTVFMYALEM